MVNTGFTYGFAITPSDTALQPPCRAIYVGVAGDVVAKLGKDGTAVTFKAVPVGILWVAPRLVLATGTTATNLIGLSNH